MNLYEPFILSSSQKLCSACFGWMVKGGHSKTFLVLALCSKTTPSLLKVRGGGWVVAHGIIVSDPVPIGQWIFTALGLGLGLGGLDLGLGLDDIVQSSVVDSDSS